MSATARHSESAVRSRSPQHPPLGIDSASPISSSGSTRCSAGSSDCGETTGATSVQVVARRSSETSSNSFPSWSELGLPTSRNGTGSRARHPSGRSDSNRGEADLSSCCREAAQFFRHSSSDIHAVRRRGGPVSSDSNFARGVVGWEMMERRQLGPEAARNATSPRLKVESKRMARTSRLDYSSCHSSINRSGFRGFLNLFSVCVTAYLVFDPVMRYLETGRFVDSSLAQAMFADVVFLLSFWAHCFCWSFTSFGLYKLYSHGLLSRKAAQFLHQALILYLVVASVFHCLYKDWPLLPSGFCLIVTHIFLMKMHSFMDTLLNSDFVCLTSDSTSGGNKDSSETVETKYVSTGPPVESASSPSVQSAEVLRPQSTGMLSAETMGRCGTTTGTSTAESLLNRSTKEETTRALKPQILEDAVTTATESKDSDDNDGTEPNIRNCNSALIAGKFGCPRGIDDIATAVKDSRTKLPKEQRRPPIPCPTIQYFTYYLFCPVLVYENHYPRGPRFRWYYFARKVVELFTALVALYFISVRFLIPVFYNTISQSIVAAFIKLIFPVLCCYLLIFFLLFECVCNLLAELTEFGDREFYLDWWNSTTWDEFARKWNRPVHEFLLRHVYLKTLRQWKWKKSLATTATFFVSAVFHELIMAVCFRAVLFLMFGMMMVQIPLMSFGHHHKNTELGNWFFWLGMLFGLPLIGIVYGRAHVALIVLKQGAT